MLDLMCAKGREQFYEKMGFLARPTNQLGPGMILYLNDRNGEKCEKYGKAETGIYSR
jgi:hypothetical protein